MFPRINSNFASGNYRPPSKNVNQQQMFQSPDPYAQSLVAQRALAQRGMAFGGAQSPLTAQARLQQNALAGPRGVAGVSAVPQGSLAGLEEFAGATPAQLATIRAANVNPNENVDIRNASRVVAGALGTNPYISQQGKEQLLRGYVPDLNAISPAFAQYTDPTIVAALQGLYQSVGIRPETQAFMRGLWTPQGL